MSPDIYSCILLLNFIYYQKIDIMWSNKCTYQKVKYNHDDHGTNPHEHNVADGDVVQNVFRIFPKRGWHGAGLHFYSTSVNYVKARSVVVCVAGGDGSVWMVTFVGGWGASIGMQSS